MGEDLGHGARNEPRFASFGEFYPYYLGEHRDRTSRRLHFVGTVLFIGLIVYACATGRWLLLLAAPVVGYGLAWTGHFFFEKNKPATFSHPIYSFMGDLMMLRDLLIRRIRW